MANYIPLTESEIRRVSCAEGVDRLFREIVNFCKVVADNPTNPPNSREQFHNLSGLHYDFYHQHKVTYHSVANEWIKQNQYLLEDMSQRARYFIIHVCRFVSRHFDRVEGPRLYPYFSWLMTDLGDPILPMFRVKSKPEIPPEQKALMDELREIGDRPPNA